MLSASLEWLLLVLFLAGFFAFIAWMFASARWKAAEKKQRLISQGFTPVDPAAIGLSERVKALYQRYPSQRLRLHDVYQKQIPDGQAYLFDLEDTGGEDSSWVGRGIISITSPLLQLPAFSIVPQLKVDGKASNFMLNASVKVIEWAASKSGLERIQFLDNPTFDQTHLVFTRDETAVRDFLNEARLGALLSLDRPCGIEAGGDLLAVAHILYRGRPEEVNQQAVPFLLADANRIFTWFQ